MLPVFVRDPRLAGAGDARRSRLEASLRRLRDATDGALVVRTGDPADVMPAWPPRSAHAASTSPASSRPTRAGGTARWRSSLEQAGCRWSRPGRRTPCARARADRGRDAVPGVHAVLPGLAGPRLAAAAAAARRSCAGAGPSGGGPGRRPRRPGSVLRPRGGGGGAGSWHEFLDDGAGALRRRRGTGPTSTGPAGSRSTSSTARSTRGRCSRTSRGIRRRGEGARTFVTELAWREFYADVLWHRPDSAWADLRDVADAACRTTPRPTPDRLVEAWREGRTGYPVRRRRDAPAARRRAGCTTGSGW